MMQIPIILTAFSTTPAAERAQKLIETGVKKKFPGHEIFWGYNSRSVTLALRNNSSSSSDIRHTREILIRLAGEGRGRAIVQSLHLLPGQEFHCLHKEVREVAGIDCLMGMPLLSSPRDYQALLDSLTPLIERDPRQAVLLVGHGSRHPVWPAYLALETLLQRRFGARAYIGVIEHYPDTHDVEQRIAEAGFTRVLMIPLFLVTGIHYQRDMMGPGQHSWLTRLQSRGLEVESFPDGLGLLPGIDELVVRHIEEAIAGSAGEKTESDHERNPAVDSLDSRVGGR